MTISVILEYIPIGDNERSFERFEVSYQQWWELKNYWRGNIWKQLRSRGIICKEIRIIEAEYVED